MTFHVNLINLFTIVVIPYIAFALPIYSNEKFVMVGTYTSVDCHYTDDLRGKVFYMFLSWDVDNALAYIYNNKLVRNSETTLYQKVTSESFTVDRNIGEQMLVLNIQHVSLEYQNLSVVCLVKDDDGRGAVLWKKSTLLKVIDPPRILRFKSYNINVTRGASDKVEMNCSAAGYPDPVVRWWKKGLSEMVQPQTFDQESLTARYFIPTPFTASQDGIYLCQAVTSHEYMESIGLNKAARAMHLNVQYPPRVGTREHIVYTDINSSVSISIEVSGNPQPRLDCDILRIRDTKFVRVRGADSPHRFIYEVFLPKVRNRDIRGYSCRVRNLHGRDTTHIRLQLGPSRPVILSPTLSQYSNYYALWWSTLSRAPLLNVSVEVLRRNSSGDLMLMRKLHVPMYRNRYSHAQSANQTILTHVTNLTSHTAYAARVRTCNRHHCSLFSRLRPFRTTRYDGTNEMDPQVILRQRRRFMMTTTLRPSSIHLAKRCQYDSFGVYICSVSSSFQVSPLPLFLLQLTIIIVNFL